MECWASNNLRYKQSWTRGELLKDGSSLQQRGNVAEWKPIHFASQFFSGLKGKDSSAKLDLLALVWSAEHFPNKYCVRPEVQVFSDLIALSSVLRSNQRNGTCLIELSILHQFAYIVSFSKHNQLPITKSSVNYNLGRSIRLAKYPAEDELQQIFELIEQPDKMKIQKHLLPRREKFFTLLLNNNGNNYMDGQLVVPKALCTVLQRPFTLEQHGPCEILWRSSNFCWQQLHKHVMLWVRAYEYRS